MKITAYDVMGWQSNQTAEGNVLTKDDDVRIYNALIASGYFPAIGLFIGGFHAVFGIMGESVTLSGRITLVTRGIFEMSGIGWLVLLPADMVVSFDRFCLSPYRQSPVKLE